MSVPEFNTQLFTLNGSLNAFAYNLTKNSEDAKDLYQETTLRAIKNREKFNPGTNFKAWMFTIMKNIFINQYRKKQKANTVIDKTENLFYLNSGSQTIRNEADTNISLAEIKKMINDLDDGLKIPFELHYEGYKYQEISEQLNLPLGTIKSRIFFARKALKEKINYLYGDYSTIRTSLSA